jgi:hypothetical protein
MKTADVIVWLANYLYVNGQATSKKAADEIARRIVGVLIDKGVLVTEDATPPYAAREDDPEFVAANPDGIL